MAEMSSPAKNVNVDALIAADAESLGKFIRNLASDPPKQTTDDIKTYLNPVIEKFEQVAKAYLARGRELLGEEEAQPQLRLQKYSRLQAAVENHALKLYELARPNPDKTYFPESRRQLLRNLITFVAGRVPGQPFILPVLGDSFKYVHFNYVDHFGLICLPPRMALVDAGNRDLGILWHEAAGFAIARARLNDRPRFEHWAGELRERLQAGDSWNLYTDLYRQSLLDKLCGQPMYKDAGILQQIENLIGTEVFENNPETVDGDGAWQLSWLSEFLEDLYWIMVGKDDDMPGELADGVVKVLADALAATYRNLKVGDPGHPPPHLRILVAISFLCNGDQDCSNNRINELVGEHEDIFEITQDVPARELATVIETLCRDILSEQGENPWLYNSEISATEKEMAGSVLNSPTTLPRQILVLNREETPVEEPNSFVGQIWAAENTSSLLALEFTTDDPYPYGGTGAQLPQSAPWPHGPF